MLNQVFNEDCLEGMQRIPDKSIDMILCDLPYGTTACKWDVIIPFAPLWEQYERVIKDNGAIVLTASQPFTSELVTSNRRLFKYSYVWDKTTKTNHLNAKKQPLRRTEDVLVFYKMQCVYNAQGLIEGVFNNSRPNHSKYNQGDKVYGVQKETQQASSFSNYPDNVICVSNSNINSLHPTQKPVALFEYLIKTYTNEGETVLDNCMGSGTTAIACINTNRNYIGFEKEPKYYQIIQDRIKNHTPQIKLAI
jgi:site-specific DNA-methyltransferase (adenine-specific)